jgi:hypothetical protein
MNILGFTCKYELLFFSFFCFKSNLRRTFFWYRNRTSCKIGKDLCLTSPSLAGKLISKFIAGGFQGCLL